LLLLCFSVFKLQDLCFWQFFLGQLFFEIFYFQSDGENQNNIKLQNIKYEGEREEVLYINLIIVDNK